MFECSNNDSEFKNDDWHESREDKERFVIKDILEWDLELGSHLGTKLKQNQIQYLICKNLKKLV